MLLAATSALAAQRRRVQPASWAGTSFQLTTAASSATYPFSVGLAMRKGDASSIALNLSNYQVIVKRTWGDGSIKHAIVSGRAALTQNVPLTVTVTAGAAPGGTDLTASSIQAAAPTASVQCGSNGTVSLSSLLASPVRTWVSGPEMVECHYRADVGGGTLLSVWFHVRLFADGRMWVRAICENGYLDNGSGAVASNADRSYVPTVSINGSNVYTNGGASLTHYKNTRWSVEGWIGGDPQVTPKHDSAYLISTKLAPNYNWRSPSAGKLNSLTQTYTPMMQGDIVDRMSTPGYQDHIGILPLWDALYVTSGDSRAWKSMLANSSACNSRPIVARSKSAELVPRPSDFQTWTFNGAGGNSPGEPFAGALSFEVAHAMNAGYMPYLLTGDYWHYETMAMCAGYCFFNLDSNRGSGTSRSFRQGQSRGAAWMTRTVGCFAAVAPTGDAIASDYRAWLSSGGFDHFWTYGPGDGAASQIGYIMNFGTPSGPLTTQPWMQHFWIAANGFVWDIEPGLADTTKHQAVRDFMYQAVVGILGGNGAPNYCYTQAGIYDGLVIDDTVYSASGNVITASAFLATWGEVWTNTWGSDNTSCGTSLQGTSGSAPSGAAGGYWGNLLPAIAYAVDHGASGAAAAWARLTGASNWSAVTGSGFDDIPLWGIVPRS